MRNSLFDIKVDFKKSRKGYVFDVNTQRHYLDFMCMFSSLPLGYNHPVFHSYEFMESINHVAQVRMTNCEYTCDEREEFEKKFEAFAGMNHFTRFHYACTGALAVEHAVKAAIMYRNQKRISKNPVVASHSKSFHGITSVGNFLTGRSEIVGPRFEDLIPDYGWPKFDTLEDLKRILETNENVCGILMEPVQSTNGDLYYDKEYFIGLRKLADEYDVPLIFDEIQTGFGTTGKVWYYQHIGVTPDILVFGKKSQVCGFMTTKKHSIIFLDPKRMCITWDGDLVDMVRCTHVMKAIEESKLLWNAENIGTLIKSELKKNGINARGIGLLIAFDLPSRSARDRFYKLLKNSGMLCNPTGERSIRLRPNLATTAPEATLGSKFISDIYKIVTRS